MSQLPDAALQQQQGALSAADSHYIYCTCAIYKRSAASPEGEMLARSVNVFFTLNAPGLRILLL